MIFPGGTITRFFEVQGSGNTTVASTNEFAHTTIFGVLFQQSANNSETELRCGNTVLAKNYSKDLPQILMSAYCEDGINIQKTGNNQASVTVVFAPYDTGDIATSTYNTYNPQPGIASTTDIQVYGAFSAGEVLISLFLFFMIVIELSKGIARGLSNVKTSKKYLQYNGGDVEIRHDL